MWPRVTGLRAFSLGSPGEMRYRLTRAALAGEKVATGALLQQEYLDQLEPVELPGERQVLLGPEGEVAAIVEITRCETHRFIDVTWEFARDEGERFTSIDHWRSGHRSFYEREGVIISDHSLFVCVWFRIVPDPRYPA
jgi:uncharacterized protein YhfF